jgi:hypothetical protein
VAQNNAFDDLIAVVPTTFDGVIALLTYLNEVAEREAWKFEEGVCVPLIANLAEALGRLAVRS